MKRIRSDNVIRLSNKLSNRSQTDIKKDACRFTRHDMRVIAITSGKGGVGKTNIVANLGYALSRLGKQVLILDADLGLGNLDVLLGLTPKYNLSHVIKGVKSIPSITIDGPGNMKILPASSGIQELTKLTKNQKIRMLSDLDSLSESIDVLLIDTAAGISSNVMYFNISAQEIMVVVTPEPTSITDAYALMKVMSVKYSERNFKLLVNLAANPGEAYDVYRQLNVVTDKFLDISIEYIGCILFDKNVAKGVRAQKVVSEMYPDTKASRCFTSVAKKICASQGDMMPRDGSSFFWEQLLSDRLE